MHINRNKLCVFMSAQAEGGMQQSSRAVCVHVSTEGGPGEVFSPALPFTPWGDGDVVVSPGWGGGGVGWMAGGLVGVGTLKDLRPPLVQLHVSHEVFPVHAK